MSEATKKNNTETQTEGRKRRLFFTGFTMGLADLIPGVSGGTIAFLFGIYDELLYTIRLLSGHVPRLIFKGRFKEAYNIVPFGFLIPLAIGILGAIFGLVQIVEYLLENHAVYVWSAFFGLVLGSAVVVSRRVSEWNVRRNLLLLLGFIVTYLVLGLPVFNTAATPLVLFGTGAIASIAMILPGISGSLIMVMLGQYENVISAVAERNVVQLVYFAIGAILGLAVFARLLTWLLKNYHAAVIAFLIGVMLGSLRRIWPWQAEESYGISANILPELNIALLFSILLSAAGFLLVWQLERIGVAREHADIENTDFKREVRAQHD